MHDIIRVGKYGEEIKNDEIWGTKIGGPPQMGSSSFKRFSYSR